MIQVDDQYRIIYYYHHRNKDGLIYREEQIKKKTFERYKGRDDNLIYRSVTYAENQGKGESNQVLTVDDANIGQPLKIKKMAQKFALDPNRPAEEQIRKTVFKLEGGKSDQGETIVYFHYKEGQIFREPKVYDRQELISQGKSGDLNEKDNDESKEQQEFKQIGEMEAHCHAEIKKEEKQASSEREHRRDKEKVIHQQRSQAQPDEIFSKILEKSIYEKARDKMKQDKQKVADEIQDETAKDYLLPILKKLSLENKELDEESAIHVKNQALKNLKERLLIRAEIIQRRLADEQKNLEQAFAQLKRKGEAVEDQDTQDYDKKMDQINFKIDILTERASQHYRTSLKKFEELDQKLSNDPRLKALNKYKNKN